MLQSIKLRIGRVLTSDLSYNLFVRPNLRNGCVRTSAGLINVDRQSRYISALLFWRIYENAERKLIRRYMRKDLPVVELGASIGMTTLTICKTVNPGIPVVCVEANPNLLANLLGTKAANRLDNLQIVQAAIEYVNQGKVSFAIDSNNLGSHKGDTAGSITVDAVKLGEIVETNKFDRYTLISDIEGAELEIALYERQEILDKCDQVIIEVHDTAHNGRSYHTLEVIHLLEKKFAMQTVFSKHNTVVLERQKK